MCPPAFWSCLLAFPSFFPSRRLHAPFANTCCLVASMALRRAQACPPCPAAAGGPSAWAGPVALFRTQLQKRRTKETSHLLPLNIRILAVEISPEVRHAAYVFVLLPLSHCCCCLTMQGHCSSLWACGLGQLLLHCLNTSPELVRDTKHLTASSPMPVYKN